MKVGWLKVVIGTIFISLVLTVIFTRGRSWLEPSFWKVPAIISTIVMSATLIILTFDSMSKVSPGKGRVPDVTVINKEIGYVLVEKRNLMEPVIGKKDVGLFQKKRLQSF